MNGGYYGGVYGFNFDGTQKFFNSNEGQYDEWTPTLFNGILYTWVGGTIKALDPVTGNIFWSVSQPYYWHGWSMGCAAPIINNHIFLNGTQTLSAVDITTQTGIWTNTGTFTGTPAVANNKVYVISNSEVLILDEATGIQLGAYTTQDTGLIGQPILANDSLVVSSGSATYIFDLASQTLLQTIPFGGNVCVAGGSIYIASTSSSSMKVYRPSPILTNSGIIAPGTNNTISWQACPAATSYEVQVATDSNFTSPTSSGWINSTNYSFSGLTINTTYYYRAHAQRVMNGSTLWQSPWSDLLSTP